MSVCRGTNAVGALTLNPTLFVLVTGSMNPNHRMTAMSDEKNEVIADSVKDNANFFGAESPVPAQSVGKGLCGVCGKEVEDPVFWAYGKIELPLCSGECVKEDRKRVADSLMRGQV